MFRSDSQLSSDSAHTEADDPRSHMALGGNTRTPRPSRPRHRGRAWCFTLNNPTGLERAQLQAWFELKQVKWLWGEEIGESGTPHLQGYFEGKHQIAWQTVKDACPRWHFQMARGSSKQNIEYCSKSGQTVGPLRPQKTLKDQALEEEYGPYVLWKPWQQHVLALLEGPVAPRKIYWFWECEGNMGKSYLAKYIGLTRATILANGKTDNVYNQVLKRIEENPSDRFVVIIDVPRDKEGHLHYGGIEAIKNGFFYSGKYEGGVCYYPIPHVIVFANFTPTYGQWSDDRCHVTNIRRMDELTTTLWD